MHRMICVCTIMVVYIYTYAHTFMHAHTYTDSLHPCKHSHLFSLLFLYPMPAYPASSSFVSHTHPRHTIPGYNICFAPAPACTCKLSHTYLGVSPFSAFLETFAVFPGCATCINAIFKQVFQQLHWLSKKTWWCFLCSSEESDFTTLAPKPFSVLSPFFPEYTSNFLK